MKDNVSIRVLSNYSPLFRAPLLLNNLIAIIILAVALNSAISIVELVFVILSGIFTVVELVLYRRRCHALRAISVEDRPVRVSSFTMLADLALVIALLIIWIIGLITYFVQDNCWSGDGTAKKMTVICTFLAWLSHTCTLIAQLAFWKYRNGESLCQHCGHGLLGLEIEGAIQIITEAPTPRTSADTADTLYNENEDGESAALLEKDACHV